MTNDELQNKIANQQEALNGLNKRVRELISERDFLVAQVDKLTADRNKLQEIVDYMGETDSRWDAMRRDYETLSDEMKEMRRTHMRLPVDADGVPIWPGDTVEDIDRGCRFMVIRVGFYKGRWGIHGHRPNELRHVQPDTVESLIDELLEEANCKINEDGSCEMGVSYARRAEYAERIRKVIEE